MKFHLHFKVVNWCFFNWALDFCLHWSNFTWNEYQRRLNRQTKFKKIRSSVDLVAATTILSSKKKQINTNKIKERKRHWIDKLFLDVICPQFSMKKLFCGSCFQSSHSLTFTRTHKHSHARIHALLHLAHSSDHKCQCTNFNTNRMTNYLFLFSIFLRLSI